MRDEDGSEPKIVSHAIEHLVGIRARNGVEAAEGLVEQDHALACRERTGERRALPLSAGEFVRQSIAKSHRIEPDEIQSNVGSLRAVRHAGQHRDERNVASHRPVWQQSAVLWYVADPPPKRDGVERGHVRAIDPDRSAVGINQAVERSQQRGLA